MSDFIHAVPIKVPNKSGFDFDYENGLTGKTGQLIPLGCHELLPNDTISLGSVFQVQLPPMVSDFLGRIDYVIEAFFVPNRLLWAGWDTFATHPTANPLYPSGYPAAMKVDTVPHIKIDYQWDDVSFSPNVLKAISDYFGPGSLGDYLDAKIDSSELERFIDDGDINLGKFSILPFLAYHKIYDDWYRDSRIQAPLFYEPSSITNLSSTLASPSFLPYVNNVFLFGDSVNEFPLFSFGSNPSRTSFDSFIDGSRLYEIRQRNWAKDYFTSASLQPQASIVGSKVIVETDGDGVGSLSIAAIRAANSLQQWTERMNLSGYRYADQIYGQFGIYPADAIMDRPLYLGRHKETVYTRSVFQQSQSENNSSNPFGGNVGAKFGSSQVVGDGSIIDTFTASEHGFLVIIGSLVPRAYYSTGVHRKFKRIELGDFPFPLLANMGDQAIQMYELGVYKSDPSIIFGYTDMYAEMKVNNDQIHGLLRDDSTLSMFALQRSFDSSLDGINSEFLQIPTNYLDQVTTISTDELGCSYWADIYFKFKKVSTLPVYSQPTLMDLQNGHVVNMPRGGKRL